MRGCEFIDDVGGEVVVDVRELVNIVVIWSTDAEVFLWQISVVTKFSYGNHMYISWIFPVNHII